MKKGYWIAFVTVTDEQRYPDYQRLAPEAFTTYGAVALAQGGRSEALEGPHGARRTVVFEFESYERALACYHSPEYQRAREARAGAAEVEIVITEGR